MVASSQKEERKMVARFEALTRPTAGIDFRKPSKQRQIGLGLAFIGVVIAVVTLIANIAAAGDVGDGTDSTRETLAWSFGLTTTAFGTIKLGIAVILVGILVRLWLRVDSVKESLPHLRGPGNGAPAAAGTLNTPWGKATATTSAPGPLPVHKMAKTMWFPMLAMGFMALLAGLVVSLVAAGESGGGFVSAFAWAQGLQFLGEAMLLGGIAFLLGSILAALRAGGGEVQESLGITVKTLKMPLSAKIFVGLMMVGMMLGVLQFILYIFVATDASASPAAWFAWLGPLRELSLGLILASIVLALYTIGTALGFQFNRIKEIIVEGR
jgi:hypothetical protein